MNKPVKTRPLLPRLLAMPSSLLPDTVHSRLIARVLNRALVVPLRDGELDFLIERCIAIVVRDAGITFRLTLADDRLTACSGRGPTDLTIEATVYDFLRLISRQADPDTLVFQRNLLMQGDTELGLQVKNLLDSLDVDSMGLYRQVESLLKQALPVYERVFSNRQG